MQRVVHIAVGLFSLLVFSQNKEVNWLSFEELESVQLESPKKVLIQFYADWCVYCKKMDESVFSKSQIIDVISSRYYAVRFNVESRDTVYFGGKTFVNKNRGTRRIAIHQIPELLAGRPNRDLELPVTVLLNKEFEIVQRYYRYIPPKEMLAILKSD
jgi:thioredoxin-related protein